MNAEKLMDAIGGINDSHVEKYAVILQKPRKTIWDKAITVAACLCVLLSAVIIITGAVYSGKRQSAGLPDGNNNVIWSEKQESESLDKYIQSAVCGEIAVTHSLQKAMDDNDNDSALYAVCVTEATGQSTEYVYNRFIKSLGCKEQYLESRIIYATESQISSWTCPQDIAVVLSLAVKPEQ